MDVQDNGVRQWKKNGEEKVVRESRISAYWYNIVFFTGDADGSNLQRSIEETHCPRLGRRGGTGKISNEYFWRIWHSLKYRISIINRHVAWVSGMILTNSSELEFKGRNTKATDTTTTTTTKWTKHGINTKETRWRYEKKTGILEKKKTLSL